MAAYRQVYDKHHQELTAKNRDQLLNPTLGNRVWATFFVMSNDLELKLFDLPCCTVLFYGNSVCMMVLQFCG